MRHDLVKSLTFHKLNQSWDRRGCIMTMEIADIPNHEHAVRECIKLIQKVSSLLGHYVDHSDSGDPDRKFAIGYEKLGFGEQNESWIADDVYNELHIRLIHKYWSQEQVDTFVAIMTNLAGLHKWPIISE